MIQSATSLSTAASLDEEWSATVDRRSLEILERRRNGATGRRRGHVVRRALAASDVLGLTLAFLAAQLLFGRSAGVDNRVDLLDESLIFVATLPLWIVVAKLYGLYDRDEERTDHSTIDDLVGVFHLVTVGAWILLVGIKATGLADISIWKLVAFWGLAVLLVTLGRALARMLCRRSACYVQNTAIVGTGKIAERIARKIEQHPEYGLHFVGFVDGPAGKTNGHGGPRLLGRPEDLYAIVYLYDVERIIISFSGEPDERTLAVIRSLRDLPVQVDIVPRFFELVSPNVGLHTVEGLPLMGLRPFRLSRPAKALKRASDLTLSSLMLLLLGPLLGVFAALIRLESPGPVLFRQTRMGTEGKTFEILKFRTMVADADARKEEVAHLNKHAQEGGDPRMFKVPNDPRVTRVGGFLRRYSLDELPQLLNVLRGEMSLVGPRPLILDEDQNVKEWGRRRLDVTPGITGPWQVLGRTQIPFDEMIRLDYLYVTEWSLLRDLKWILLTVPAVLRPSDAY